MVEAYLTHDSHILTINHKMYCINAKLIESNVASKLLPPVKEQVITGKGVSSHVCLHICSALWLTRDLEACVTVSTPGLAVQ